MAREAGTRAGVKRRRSDLGLSGFDRTALLDPAAPAPVENADRVVAVAGQGPPEPGGELAPHVIDGDDVSGVADAPLRHRLGEQLRRRRLGRDRVVGIHDVAGPVDVDRARDVRRQVFVDAPR